MVVLDFSTREEDTAVTVSVTGELDIVTRPVFDIYLEVILSGGPGQIIVDLSGLSFIDASGLGALATLYSRAGYEQMPVLLTGVPARILQLIKIVGLNNHIPVSP